MKEHLIDLSEAEANLAAAATYLAENIGSSDGHAEAMKEIVAYYISKGEVDLAAELADTIKDNFVRDNLLVRIAEKCAAANDDEYAFQLAEAIEDYGLQASAQERIAVQKAIRGEFDEALKVADSLSHPDDALAVIAVRQIIAGKEPEARQTISRIEYPTAAVQSLQTIAGHFYDEKDIEKANDFLAEAIGRINEIEIPEEKIRTLLAVAGQYIEAGQFDQAIEVLGEISSESEVLDSAHREGFLSIASLDFLRAGNLDLADQTLDLINDKTQVAATLAGFSAEFERKKEKTEALDTLEEAYAILKSQKDREVRDSQSRFNLLANIAIHFAALGKLERALEIALENPVNSNRDDALTQIAAVCADAGNEEFLQQSLNSISNDNARAIAFLTLSDSQDAESGKEKALQFLKEGHSIAENIGQPSARAAIFNELTKRFFKLGETDLARQTAAETLQTVPKIMDESHRSTSLLNLARVFESCNFEMNETEQKTLIPMLRKAEW